LRWWTKQAVHTAKPPAAVHPEAKAEVQTALAILLRHLLQPVAVFLGHPPCLHCIIDHLVPSLFLGLRHGTGQLLLVNAEDVGDLWISMCFQNTCCKGSLKSSITIDCYRYIAWYFSQSIWKFK
jgi:hypothetical protein